ncbi:hypothetical protein TREMEDRAFT_65781 [Tremella mesenterica DSM 1558]|uniref:uncharacterized protein n=1 Tax=Tremella mesenterica (strain ATCC 24925 / CBS 8224 / DSM 1558 / NBRC 9311 / NRRL Y-6157 / RJB 2259-6 / UBC 559-6) TaxID=578456 RepID=UPI00032BCEF0|nr:uncharacterized protein TREMEDRAFT_65781 [Tremella mesenterica DSM 1558]EIW66178.1 hypothetical protein TREMEDRAFT_65781 [Tremella mesenterica DSM 1558]
MSFQVQLTSPPSVTSLSELLRTIRSCFNALEPSISQLITEYFSPPQSHELPVLSRQIEDYLDELNNEVRLLTHATSNWKDWRTKGMSNWKSLSLEKPSLTFAPHKGKRWTKEQRDFWQVCEKGRQNLISASTRYTDLEGRVMGMIRTGEGRVGNSYGPDVKVRGIDLSTFTAYDPFDMIEPKGFPRGEEDYEENTIVVVPQTFQAEGSQEESLCQIEYDEYPNKEVKDSICYTSPTNTVSRGKGKKEDIVSYSNTLKHTGDKGMKRESIQGHYVNGPQNTLSSWKQPFEDEQDIIDLDQEEEEEEESDEDDEESDYEESDDEDEDEDEDNLNREKEKGWDKGLWYKGDEELAGKTRSTTSFR